MKAKKISRSKSALRQAALGVVTRVLRWRLKDKHAKHLLAQSVEVNQVWNYSQDLALQVLAREHLYQGKALSLRDSYALADYELRSGSFSEESRGRWCLNVSVDVKKPEQAAALSSAIGIDLGLKDFAAFSSGQTVEAQQFYRDLEPVLTTAQRAEHLARTRAIHAKIRSRRADFLHKLGTSLVKAHGTLFVGNANACGLAKTNMAKSVLNASRTTFRNQLQYKANNAGSWVREISESYTTQDCSCCGARTGPQGLSGLGMRHWTCHVCLTVHDRDTNAAKNILARSFLALEDEFTVAVAARACEAAVNKAKQLAEAGHGLPVVGIPFL